MDGAATELYFWTSMKKIVITHLGAEDRASPSYLKIEERINRDYPADQQLYTNEMREITAFLQNFDTGTEPLMITILSHGSPVCISACESRANEEWIRIYYGELLAAIAGCRTENRLILNLTACCHTHNALTYLGAHYIDEIWYNQTESDSLHKGLENAERSFASIHSADLDDHYGQFLHP